MRIARLAFLLACLLGAFESRAIASDAQAAYRHVEVPGHGGVPLNVVEAGDPAGEPVLLLHGFSQSYLSWKLQLDDPVLRARFRLIAIDLRGHGGSGKPWDPAAYAGHLPWAEDIRRVLDALDVKRPWIVGWSFGGYVAFDYVREYGADAVRGVMLAGSHGGLLPRPTVVPPKVVGDLDAVIRGSREFIDFMGARPLPAEAVERGRFSYAMLPPYARRAMSGKRLDNTDLVAALRLPLRVVLGGSDSSVPAEAVRTVLASKPNAALVVYDGIGHSPFIEAPERFRQDLLAFVEDVPSGEPVPVPEVVARYIDAVNAGDVERAVAAFAPDGEMILQRGVRARGHAELREIERFHEIARPILRPDGLWATRVGDATIVGVARNAERSRVFEAMGLGQVVTRAQARAFVVRGDRLAEAWQPPFTPACRVAMAAAMEMAAQWVNAKHDPRAAVLFENGAIAMNVGNLRAWIEVLQEARVATGWRADHDVAQQCAAGS